MTELCGLKLNALKTKESLNVMCLADDLHISLVDATNA